MTEGTLCSDLLRAIDALFRSMASVSVALVRVLQHSTTDDLNRHSLKDEETVSDLNWCILT